MAVRYQDYYQTLGVDRGAQQSEIQSAYRKLARKFHPDVNKEKGAEERFKQITEAYEVLKDPEKRSKYDALGANWRDGQDFTPPPGQRGGVHYDFGGGFGDLGGADLNGGDFSAFFESLFGGAGPTMHRAGGSRRARRGQSHEADVELSLEDIARGGVHDVVLRSVERDEYGRAHQSDKTYAIKVPPGTTEGTTIRLAGQGGQGAGGGEAGDLLLRVHVAPHPRFQVDGHDLKMRLRVAPWEAALGAKVAVALISGEATLTIPPGSASGTKLRLRGQGLPKRGDTRGDLVVELEIAVPAHLTDRERALFEELARESKFDPRA
jgi:curved DNA-binding protein